SSSIPPSSSPTESRSGPMRSSASSSSELVLTGRRRASALLITPACRPRSVSAPGENAHQPAMARRTANSHGFLPRDLGGGGFAPRRSSRRGLVLICGLEGCCFAISGSPFQTLFGLTEPVQLAHRILSVALLFHRVPVPAR